MKLSKEIKNHWFIYLSGVFIPLAAYILFVGFPLVKSIYLSFTDWDGLGQIHFIGFENYSKLIANPNFTLSLRNNILWAVISLIIPVGGGFILAVLLKSKSLYFKTIFRLLIFLPCTMSLAATGVIFSVILSPIFGGLNAGLNAVGLGSLIQGWLENPRFVMYTLLAVFSWNYLGMPMMIFHAGLGQIEPELYEIAELEGATPLQTLWYVTVPLMKSVITVVVLLVMITSLRAFDLVTVMTKGGPNKSSNVLAYYMYIETFHKYDFGYGAAISVSILLLSTVFAALYLRNISKKALSYE